MARKHMGDVDTVGATCAKKTRSLRDPLPAQWKRDLTAPYRSRARNKVIPADVFFVERFPVIDKVKESRRRERGAAWCVSAPTVHSIPLSTFKTPQKVQTGFCTAVQ